MTISKSVIDVIVDYIPESVKCSAIAHPEPTFRWYREGSTDTITQSSVLVFETKVPKRSNGTYICEATNRHGSQNISTYLNVLCQYLLRLFFFFIFYCILFYFLPVVMPFIFLFLLNGFR